LFKYKTKIMKRNLLLIASLFVGASTAMAQFTDANAPQIGEGATLFIVDSLAPNLAAETGGSATWDYSGTLGYENETRAVTMLDATTTAEAASFPSSTEALDLESFLLNYTSSSATIRESHGFVFTEQTIGEIVARFDVNAAQTHAYPMNFGDAEIIDTYSGEVDYNLGIAQSATMSGILRAQVDGEGTLKLADNDYPNVLRYKIIDTMNVTILGFGDLEMVRAQYEYYDLDNEQLPIFIHTNVKFGQVGGAPMSDISLVLSKEQPSLFVSVSTNVLEQTAVYPNPANEHLNIELPSSIESADVVISDALGREVYASTLNAAVKTIDVSKMNKGMYFVNISNEIYSTTKSVVIK
jgi:hypothetical protein